MGGECGEMGGGVEGERERERERGQVQRVREWERVDREGGLIGRWDGDRREDGREGED